MSSGEFVGIVSDEARRKKKLKAFHAEIVVNDRKVEDEEADFEDLPVRAEVTQDMINEHFSRIKAEIAKLVAARTAVLKEEDEFSRVKEGQSKGRIGRGRRIM